MESESLLQTIKKAQLKNRKEFIKNKDVQFSDAAKLLTTLIGEAEIIGKNEGNRETTNDEVVKVIKKFISNNNDLLKHKQDEKIVRENEILNSFLPKQLSKEELSSIIENIISEGKKEIGPIMKELNANHSGLFDGKLANQIIREKI